jgi:hypothetical protein
MPSELMKALRAKYKDPREAMKVLGLDEKLLEVPKAEDEEEDDDKKAKDKGGRDKAKDADPREFLKSKLSEDDMEAYDAMCKTGLDEKDDEDKKAEDAEEDDDEEKEGAKSTIKDKARDGVTKTAMDAALSAATEATARRVREAERGIRVALAEVEPWVGRLAPTLALDSAEGVYRHAAKALGVKNADKLHADALFPIIQAQPKPGEQKQASREMARDSSSYGEAVKLAPGLEHITVGA